MPGTAPNVGGSEKGETGTVSAHLGLMVYTSPLFLTPASAPALPESPTDQP